MPGMPGIYFTEISETAARAVIAKKPFCRCGKKIVLESVADRSADTRTGKRTARWTAVCESLTGVLGGVRREMNKSARTADHHQDEAFAINPAA
jgi:hypothetical protein